MRMILPRTNYDRNWARLSRYAPRARQTRVGCRWPSSRIEQKSTPSPQPFQVALVAGCEQMFCARPARRRRI